MQRVKLLFWNNCFCFVLWSVPATVQSAVRQRQCLRGSLQTAGIFIASCYWSFLFLFNDEIQV